MSKPSRCRISHDPRLLAGGYVDEAWAKQFLLDADGTLIEYVEDGATSASVTRGCARARQRTVSEPT
jgi:hypothetical protein